MVRLLKGCVNLNNCFHQGMAYLTWSFLYCLLGLSKSVSAFVIKPPVLTFAQEGLWDSLGSIPTVDLLSKRWLSQPQRMMSMLYFRGHIVYFNGHYRILLTCAF